MPSKEDMLTVSSYRSIFCLLIFFSVTTCGKDSTTIQPRRAKKGGVLFFLQCVLFEQSANVWKMDLHEWLKFVVNEYPLDPWDDKYIYRHENQKIKHSCRDTWMVWGR